MLDAEKTVQIRQRVKDMLNIINADLSSAIKSRQEGKDVLSWIENFGLYLSEGKSHVSFQKGENNMMLVLRIRNKFEETSKSRTEKDTISAYLCFFKTDDNGFTRFCVNAACDEDVEGLKDLMVDKAHWTDESTKNWWKEVFRDLKCPIDEDTLRRKEVLASDSLKMNMMDFIEKIQEIAEKAISKLNVDKQKIRKACIVEQYAMALPFRYAINRMFPNAKGEVYPFVWKEKKMSWLQYASHFQVPGKLLHASLLTSPQISIGDVLNQKKGIEITLPLSKEDNKKFFSPFSAIFDNSDLKWNELLRENAVPDYVVGNLAFKRVQVSIFSDGFQRLYVRGCKDVIALLAIKGNMMVAKVKDNNADRLIVKNNKEDISQQKTTKKQTATDSDQGEKRKIVSCMEMVYVIDTNVFLDCPNILDFVPANYKIGLTAKIIDEIDDNKNKSEDLKKRAVQAQKNIRQENKKGNRIIFKEPNLKLLNGLNGAKPDNKILALALTLKTDGYEPTVLTSDNGLLLSADLHRISTLELSEIRKQKG